MSACKTCGPWVVETYLVDRHEHEVGSTHSPGPVFERARIVASDGFIVARMVAGGTSDARLIAAAPDLADALEAAFAELDNCAANDEPRKGDEFRYGHRCPNCDENVDRNGDTRRQIRAALRKAGRIP